MKRMLAVVCIAVLLPTLCGCVPMRDPRKDKETAFRLVIDNEALLRAYIAEGDFDTLPQIKGIVNVHGNGNGSVDFMCGGHGFGPATAYFGFCYVPDNDYRRITFAEYTDPAGITIDENGYSYKQTDGDNEWHAERITDGFWYYEAAF